MVIRFGQLRIKCKEPNNNALGLTTNVIKIVVFPSALTIHLNLPSYWVADAFRLLALLDEKRPQMLSPDELFGLA
jgi:hypothetical protein